MKFELISDYCPTGDQPEAIAQLVEGLRSGMPAQTLLGVTGSGKTFTIANVIKEINRPTLILSHNKTLAAQLYNEFKSFFPNNAVEYYVSYYDYYQPEAYIPSTDTYIEKDLAINDEIDKLRLAATSALLSGRKDVVVISSVSCIYGMGNPSDFYKNVIEIKTGMKLDRNVFLRWLVSSLYQRNDLELHRGMFRVKGDTVDVSLAYSDHVLRVTFWDDEVESIEEIDVDTGRRIIDFDEYKIYPANLFMTTKESTLNAIHQIENDLTERVEYFKEIGKPYEAKRLYERVTYDMEMLRELGHCSGIENYSRDFDGREPGTRPYCLLDFFPKDFLMVIDESHVSVPQIHAMYGGDRARKTNLVEFGFRLPAALDNRPLKFEEFQSMTNQVIYVSATPDEYELAESGGVVVEQLIRPTGLLDPLIEVRSSMNQVDDLMEEIQIRTEREERVLVTTLTKRMAEELTDYLLKNGVRCNYIHSDVDTLERVQIMTELREGYYEPVTRRPRPAGSIVGSHTRRRQGRIPAQPPLADTNCRTRRTKRQRKSDFLCRPHHTEHEKDHGRDEPTSRKADCLQRGQRHCTQADTEEHRQCAFSRKAGNGQKPCIHRGAGCRLGGCRPHSGIHEP